MSGKADTIALITRSLGEHLTVSEGAAPNEVLLQLRAESLRGLPEICTLLTKSLKARFTTLVANDERSLHGQFALYYIFAATTEDLFLILQVPVDPRHMEVPSVSPVLGSADWFEREVKDWFGIIAFPNLRRVAVLPDWPEDVHPMLKDFDRSSEVPRVRGSFDFKHVEGEGVFEIPVGPVHAGIIEPGHFRFSVAGEPIINLDVQLFYTHKGTEKLAEGMPLRRAAFLAERISGDSSFAHCLAYCHALERLSSCEVPKRAEVLRTMLLELERLYNHIGDIGAILLDVGYAAGAARAFALKERFLALNELLTGSRLLRAVCTPGGVRGDPEGTLTRRQALRDALREGKEALESLVEQIMKSSSVLDRLEGTGKLSRTEAYRLGITGIAGRASGIDRDFRRDHPHGAYANVHFKVALRTEGDVLARLRVRVEEAKGSLAIIGQLQHQHLGEHIVAELPEAPPHRFALGYAEGWRGEIVHWLMTGTEGRIYRWKITDPSFRNWRALPAAVRNNIVPDFPVINKSFNLSYSGNDR